MKSTIAGATRRPQRRRRHGLSAARIYRVRGGSHDGRWFSAVQIGRGRVPFNSGTGNADGGREAPSAIRRSFAG
jgi:hypothetical protein